MNRYSDADLISRQAAIDALKKIDQELWGIDIEHSTVPEYIEHHEQIKAVRTIVQDLIDQIKDEPSAQQWIPCSERLPEYKQEIFFTEKNNETGELYVGRGLFCGVTERTGSLSNPWHYADTFSAAGRRWHVLDSKIVAWFPVPQPWEGGQNEQIH